MSDDTRERQEGPTGAPLLGLDERTVYHDALPCPTCKRRARGGGCGSRDCPLLTFRGAGLPGRRPWETNHA